MLKGLGHVGILVRDIEISKRFYEKIGFTVEGTYPRPGDTIIAFIEAGSCVIELIQPGDRSRMGRPAGIIDHLCIDVDDIDAEIKNLQALGILGGDAKAGTIADMYGGLRNVFFEGPDGERLEYSQKL